MKKYFKILLVLTFFNSTNTYATTWDEPWANVVIRESTSFVLAKVISTDPENGIKIFVLKTVSGKKLTDTILISNFYLLSLCSSSGGHGAVFHTAIVDS